MNKFITLAENILQKDFQNQRTKDEREKLIVQELEKQGATNSEAVRAFNLAYSRWVSYYTE